jgi:hypothetical protein
MDVVGRDQHGRADPVERLEQAQLERHVRSTLPVGSSGLPITARYRHAARRPSAAGRASMRSERPSRSMSHRFSEVRLAGAAHPQWQRDIVEGDRCGPAEVLEKPASRRRSWQRLARR